VPKDSAQQQHMADFYVRVKKEQEGRENAEARELFLEQQQCLTVNRPIKPWTLAADSTIRPVT
jgi:hypothetical protein